MSANLGLDALDEEVVAGAEIDVGEGIEVGRAALLGGGEVLDVEARVGEHHVMARPVGVVDAGGAGVVEEEGRRVERLARGHRLEARPEHGELDGRRRGVAAHLEQRGARGAAALIAGALGAALAVVGAAGVGAHALREEEEHVAAGRGRAIEGLEPGRAAQAGADLRALADAGEDLHEAADGVEVDHVRRGGLHGAVRARDQEGRDDRERREEAGGPRRARARGAQEVAAEPHHHHGEEERRHDRDEEFFPSA